MLTKDPRKSWDKAVISRLSSLTMELNLKMIRGSLSAIFVTTAMSFLFTPPAWCEYLYVNTEMANVRGTPSVDGNVVATMKFGYSLKVIERDNGWTKVEFFTGAGRNEGWIKSSLLVNKRPPEVKVYQTSFGPLTFVGDSTFSARYTFNGEERETEAGMPTQQFGDHFLMSLFGGQLCPATYFWLTATEDGVLQSDTFGNCSDIFTPTVGEGWVELEMYNTMGQVEYWRYDGRRVELRTLERFKVDVENSMDPYSWVGMSAKDYLSSEITENYLLSLMSVDELNLVNSLAIYDIQTFTDEGDWIVAVSGFAFLAGSSYDGEAKAMVALSKETGEALIFAMRHRTIDEYEKMQWGAQAKNLTGTMRKVLSR